MNNFLRVFFQKIERIKSVLIAILILILIANIIFVINKNNDISLQNNIEGTYTVTKNGTKNNLAVIDGNSFTVQCLRVEGNYVIVKNFVVEDCPSHGIYILGNNVTVENNTVRYSVTENGRVDCGILESKWGSGIKTERGSHDVLINENEVYENCGEGIAATMSYNITIDKNTVWDNFSVNIYVDNSFNVSVVNNRVYCTGIYLRDEKQPTGIAFAEEFYEDWGTQRHDNEAINNQIDGCDAGIVSWNSQVPTGKEVRLLIEGNRVFNTIGRSIELNTSNEDVIVRNNLSDKPIFVLESIGVEIMENIAISPTVSSP